MNNLLSEIELALKKYIHSQKYTSDIFCKNLQEAMAYSLLNPGKRIRPLLLLVCAQALRPTNKNVIKICINPAIALELIHTYSLIHDDLPCMDDDDFRRNKPSLHVKFTQGIAVLAGDALLSDSFKLLAHHKNGHKLCYETSLRIGSSGLVGGQALDILNENLSRSKEDWQVINNAKTAKLFELACLLAAICVDASKEEISLCKNFGLLYGQAFQLKDDIDDKSGLFAYGHTQENLDEYKNQLINLLAKFSEPKMLYELVTKIL